MDSLSPRTLRIAITAGLVVLLIGILGAYIYIGMYYARQGEVADTTPAIDMPLSKRDQVLEALSNAPAPDPAKRAEVLKSLDATAASKPTDAAKRQQVLDALSASNPQNPE